eukprot:jgi/Galph1/1087/GphlegSOOS_G5879.1
MVAETVLNFSNTNESIETALDERDKQKTCWCNSVSYAGAENSVNLVNFSENDVLFFDCDDTLYPSSCKVSEHVKRNIAKYVEEKLGIPSEEAVTLQKSLFEEYGTTLRGLQERYPIDPYDYWSHIHWSLPYESLIEKDPQLRNVLTELPCRRYLFTNADRQHALFCLQVLDISPEIFDDLIDIEALGFKNKPDPHSFMNALNIANVKEPSRALLLDDSSRNLIAAKQMGWRVIAVGEASLEVKHICDGWVPSLHHLPCILRRNEY